MCSIIEADMAWDSDVRPDKILYNHSVPADIARSILSVVLKTTLKTDLTEENSLKSLKPVTDPAGHYCLHNGKEKLFLRITRRSRKNTDIEDLVTNHLFDTGITVNLPIVSKLTIHWKGHAYLLSIFPFIEGRHFNGSDGDLISLSITVARMHEALRSFKSADYVHAAALKTADRLSNTKEIIAHSLKTNNFSMFYGRLEWAERNYKWLKMMVEGFNPYLCKEPDAQCVHGELHTGNVIFSLHDGTVVLIDFEETPDAWFPPAFDLAYLVHRFCMDQNISKSLFNTRLKIVEDNYGKIPSGLKNMMRQVCWYNIALLTDRCFRRESVSPEKEYDKFVRLENMTNVMK